MAAPTIPAPLGASSAVDDAVVLSFATLFDDPQREQLVQSVREFSGGAGITLALESIPTELARVCTVGRIGVPLDAAGIMRRQRVVLGAGFGARPLMPVARLWRGLQRRADVIVDIRRSTTLPGSAAARDGKQRDVLLVTQHVLDRSRSHLPTDTQRAEHWARAREGAEYVYRLAAAEQRSVLLVRPIGRSTGAQQGFVEALERHARAQRVPAPRIVKAGLLAALLSGANGDTRWLAASVMPMNELSALVTEAIGDTGAWPMVSVGRDATFYDMPVSTVCAHDPTPLILAIVDQLLRCGRARLARTMFDAFMVTTAAVGRMREELGGTLTMPATAFLKGMQANWGRVPVGAQEVPLPVRASRRTRATASPRLRIEPSTDSGATRSYAREISAQL